MNKADYIATADRKDHVIEECAELTQAICKARRFGWFNYHPDRPGTTNYDDVILEMDNVVQAIERLQEEMREVKRQHFGD
jgi:hypothetical protein